jgi:hypothetical protein
MCNFIRIIGLLRQKNSGREKQISLPLNEAKQIQK